MFPHRNFIDIGMHGCDQHHRNPLKKTRKKKPKLKQIPQHLCLALIKRVQQSNVIEILFVYRQCASAANRTAIAAQEAQQKRTKAAKLQHHRQPARRTTPHGHSKRALAKSRMKINRKMTQKRPSKNRGETNLATHCKWTHQKCNAKHQAN